MNPYPKGTFAHDMEEMRVALNEIRDEVVRLVRPIVEWLTRRLS